MNEKLLIIFGGINLAAAIILVIVLFIKYGMEHRPSARYKYFGELPDHMLPAEVNTYLRHNNPNSAAVTATILDLSRRGYIEFEIIIKKEGFFKRGKAIVNIKALEKEYDGLRDYEKILLNLLDDIYSSCINFKEYYSKNPSSMYDFLDKWKTLVKQSIEENYYNYFETAPWGARAALLTLSMLNVLWSVLSCLKKELIILIFTVPAVFILLFGTKILKRKSQKGADSMYRWKAFKKYLRNFLSLDSDEIPEISIWQKYLVYAVSLGEEKQVLKQLTRAYPEVKKQYYGSWFNYFGFMYGEANTIESLPMLESLLETLSQAWAEAFTT